MEKLQRQPWNPVVGVVSNLEGFGSWTYLDTYFTETSLGTIFAFNTRLSHLTFLDLLLRHFLPISSSGFLKLAIELLQYFKEAVKSTEDFQPEKKKSKSLLTYMAYISEEKKKETIRDRKSLPLFSAFPANRKNLKSVLSDRFVNSHSLGTRASPPVTHPTPCCCP